MLSTQRYQLLCILILFFLYSILPKNFLRFMYQQTQKVLKGSHLASLCLKQTFISGDCGVSLVRLVIVFVSSQYIYLLRTFFIKSSFCEQHLKYMTYTIRILLANQDTLSHLQLDTPRRQILTQR